jgi:hypothetical protein
MWYPAKKSDTDSVTFFHELVYLLELRSKRFDDSRDYSGLSNEMLQYFCGSTECSDYNFFKSIPTESYTNAQPVTGDFPLVIYFSALNGMSYENYKLFESLANNGFIVAAISSIGRYPGNMTMEIEDLMEQIGDGKFIHQYLTSRHLVSDKIGLVGYSWGGLAASLWAMMEPNKINTIVTLDGSQQFHYYGNDEDGKINVIRQSSFFRPEAIQSSFFQLTSDIETAENMPDSIFDFNKSLRTDHCYLRFVGSKHEDFGVYGTFTEDDSRKRYNQIKELAVSYLCDKFFHTNTFANIVAHSANLINDSSLSTGTSNDEEQKILSGILRDHNTKTVLPYVNVGIVDKGIGTTTDINGRFELALSETNKHDHLRLSMIGYETRDIELSELFNASKVPITLYLKEKARVLEEVVLMSKEARSRIVGNTSRSKFFGGKFASNDLGSEFALRINLRNKPAFFEKLQFNISYNDVDTASFRFNVYSIKNGVPFENITPDNVIVGIGPKQTGKVELDLVKYNIVLADDCYVGLEWIEGRSNSGIVFSAGFGSKTYFRKASQGRWKKYPIGVGLNINVKY